MSSPFNVSPWFTIVLMHISSVFKELQGQPFWIPSRGHPISREYAHIYGTQDIHHLHIPDVLMIPVIAMLILFSSHPVLYAIQHP